MYNQELVNNHYPNAHIYEPMKVWTLPKNKKHMLEEICGNGDYFAQLKKDGNWYNFVIAEDGGCYLFSRGISVKTKLPSEAIAKVPHIEKVLSKLPRGTSIVGEIYYPNGNTNDVRSIMGCLPKKSIERQKEKGNIHFYIHDVLEYDGVETFNLRADERYSLLTEKVQPIINDSVELEIAEAYYENIYEEVAKALASGEEGMVLKLKSASYQEGKKPAWQMIKVKVQDTVDVVCMGFLPPTKEYTGDHLNTWKHWENAIGELEEFQEMSQGRVDLLILNGYSPVTKPYFYGWVTSMEIGGYDGDGSLIRIGKVSSGFSDSQREEFSLHPELYIGRTVECDCMEKTSDSLRHPIFKNFRSDKNAEECLLKDILKS